MDTCIWHDRVTILDYDEQGIDAFVEILDASRPISRDVK